MSHSASADVVVIGGGIIGLTTAYELAGKGASVLLLDRQTPGKEASWAGGGILPPGSWYSQHPTLERFAAESRKLFPTLVQEIYASTGINAEYQTCGAIYLRDNPCSIKNEADQRLDLYMQRWQELEIQVEKLKTTNLLKREPAIQLAEKSTPADEAGYYKAGYYVPAEAQVRNPRLLKGLLAACQQRGVQILPFAEVRAKEAKHEKVQAVFAGHESSQKSFSADHFIITAGSWSGPLANLFGLELPVKPIRGQILLLEAKKPLISNIVYQGNHYLVPRLDGKILVGSSTEDVGFTKKTTPEVTRELLAFATRVLPELKLRKIEQSWAGLRPCSHDELPYLGKIPAYKNVWIATGHYRAGLQFAPPTAQVISALVRGVKPPYDITAFAPERVQTEAV